MPRSSEITTPRNPNRLTESVRLRRLLAPALLSASLLGAATGSAQNPRDERQSPAFAKKAQTTYYPKTPSQEILEQRTQQALNATGIERSSITFPIEGSVDEAYQGICWTNSNVDRIGVRVDASNLAITAQVKDSYYTAPLFRDGAGRDFSTTLDCTRAFKTAVDIRFFRVSKDKKKLKPLTRRISGPEDVSTQSRVGDDVYINKTSMANPAISLPADPAFQYGRLKTLKAVERRPLSVKVADLRAGNVKVEVCKYTLPRDTVRDNLSSVACALYGFRPAKKKTAARSGLLPQKTTKNIWPKKYSGYDVLYYDR